MSRYALCPQDSGSHGELDIAAHCGDSCLPFLCSFGGKHHRCCGMLWSLDEVRSTGVLELLVGTVMGKIQVSILWPRCSRIVKGSTQLRIISLLETQ